MQIEDTIGSAINFGLGGRVDRGVLATNLEQKRSFNVQRNQNEMKQTQTIIHYHWFRATVKVFQKIVRKPFPTHGRGDGANWYLRKKYGPYST